MSVYTFLSFFFHVSIEMQSRDNNIAVFHMDSIRLLRKTRVKMKKKTILIHIFLCSVCLFAKKRDKKGRIFTAFCFANMCANTARYNEEQPVQLIEKKCEKQAANEKKSLKMCFFAFWMWIVEACFLYKTSAVVENLLFECRLSTENQNDFETFSARICARQVLHFVTTIKNRKNSGKNVIFRRHFNTLSR